MYINIHSVYVKFVGYSQRISHLPRIFNSRLTNNILYTLCSYVMIYLRTKSQMPTSNCWLFMAIKPKPKENVGTVVIFLYFLLQDRYFISPISLALCVGSLTVLSSMPTLENWTADEVCAQSVAICNPQADRVFQYDIFFSLWLCGPTQAMASTCSRNLDHTRHTTADRAPLDKWSARRRDSCLTTHYIHKRQRSLPLAGFEPTVSACERPQT